MAKTRKTGTQLQPGEEPLEEKRERIRQDASPALRKKLEEIQAWFDAEARHSIKTRWELAQTIKGIYDDATTNRGKRYGVHAVEQITQYFGWDDGVIYNALRLAQKFTQEEIDEVCEMRTRDGQLLSYSHLMALLMVEEPAKRREFMQKAVSENWIYKRLAMEVAPELKPKKPITDRRGRPLAIPRDFDAVLAQQESFCEDFLNRAEKVWEQDDHSLGAKLTDLGGEEFTAERASRVKALAEKLLCLSQKAKRLEEHALNIHKEFVKVLGTKPAARMLGSSEK